MTESDPRFSLEDRLFALVAFKVEGGAFPSKARLIRAGSGYGASVMGVSLPWDGLTPLIGRVTASRGILIRIGHPGCPHPARWVDPSHRTGDRFPRDPDPHWASGMSPSRAMGQPLSSDG